MLQKGVGVDRDLVASQGWFTRSAEGGNRNAMLELSKILEMGLGVPSNPEAARFWLEKSGFAGK